MTRASDPHDLDLVFDGLELRIACVDRGFVGLGQGSGEAIRERHLLVRFDRPGNLGELLRGRDDLNRQRERKRSGFAK